MRKVSAALLCSVLTGCSWILADRVIAALGPPGATCPREVVPVRPRAPGVDHVDACWDELYSVSGKFPDERLLNTYMVIDGGTLLLAEAVFTPFELVRSAYKSLTPGGLVIRYCDFATAHDSAHWVEISRVDTALTSDVDKLARRVCPEGRSDRPDAALLRGE